MQKSILLYPLNSAASPAVNAVPTVLNAREAEDNWDTVRAVVGISRNILFCRRVNVYIKSCVNDYFLILVSEYIFYGCKSFIRSASTLPYPHKVPVRSSQNKEIIIMNSSDTRENFLLDLSSVKGVTPDGGDNRL